MNTEAQGPHPLSRRTFIRGVGTAAALTAAGALGWRLGHPPAPERWDRLAFPPPDEARVAVLRAPTYDMNLEGILLAGLREIRADVRGARVLLKPNLVEFDATSAINTDPRLVAAAALAFRRLGAASVIVAEGPGHRRDTGYVVEASGLGEVLRDVQVPFVDLNVDVARTVRLRSHYTGLGDLWLPRTVTDADVVVSMPKMKTHHWAGVTLSLKNCFGCLPGRVYGWPKNVLHWQGIGGSILDIAGAVRPDYAIVDGIVAMEGNGPIDGDRKEVGLLVIGDDPVAVDVTATGLMGIDSTRVSYLVEAGRFLGVADAGNIRVAGEPPGDSAVRFELAPGFEGLSGEGGSVD